MFPTDHINPMMKYFHPDERGLIQDELAPIHWVPNLSERFDEDENDVSYMLARFQPSWKLLGESIECIGGHSCVRQILVV